MLRIFAGFDQREAEGYHVFCQSVLEWASMPVSITPLTGQQRDGTNRFTYERFLVPYYCNFKGVALFVDGSDMLFRQDPADLFAEFHPGYCVQVVKHNYTTKHPRKYLGTVMESDNADYPRKNWSSVMLWNCEAEENYGLTPDYISRSPGAHLHRFGWLQDSDIGSLEPEWNYLVGEDDRLSKLMSEPKLLHYTLGIPSISAYSDCEYAREWFRTRDRMLERPLVAKGGYAQQK